MVVYIEYKFLREGEVDWEVLLKVEKRNRKLVRVCVLRIYKNIEVMVLEVIFILGNGSERRKSICYERLL